MTQVPATIRSRDNPQVKRLLRLATSSRERRETGTTILDGEHLVQAFRQSGGTAEVVVASEAALADPRVRLLFEETPAAARLVLADSLVARISQVVTSSGVLAVVRTPAVPALPVAMDACLLLEGIQDPGNLGSILRSAAAAGVRQVFLSPGSVFAWAPKVVRAGQGAHFSLVIHEDVSFDVLRPRITSRIVATEPRAPLSIFDADLRGPIAWLFGNEGAGLSPGATALAGERLSIPMAGGTESINVASAVAVCLFEQLRQNGHGQKGLGSR
jgi:TrmH family RNA methyltransferase